MAATYRDTVPLAELPPWPKDDPLHEEWNTYLREAPRLLAEGLEGKVLLIKGESVLGRFDTRDEARMAGLMKFLFEPFLVKELLANEPLVLHVRGVSYPWPVRLTR